MVLQGMPQELSLNEKVKLSADPASITLGEELVEHLTQGIVVQADRDGERGLGSREPEQKQQSTAIAQLKPWAYSSQTTTGTCFSPGVQ